MSEETTQEQSVYWPRVKEILDGIMARWIERWGRQPLPGIHSYYWETSQELRDSVLSGLRSIEPGLPARETNLVKALARAVGTSGKMPRSEEHTSELQSRTNLVCRLLLEKKKNKEEDIPVV